MSAIGGSGGEHLGALDRWQHLQSVFGEAAGTDVFGLLEVTAGQADAAGQAQAADAPEPQGVGLHSVFRMDAGDVGASTGDDWLLGMKSGVGIGFHQAGDAGQSFVEDVRAALLLALS